MNIWAEPWDVLVVGGGPAGSAAANAAAGLGLSVVLAECGAEDRDKACGDLFVPAAAAILRRLGLDCKALQSARQACSCDAVELRGARGLLWKVRYPEEPVWIIPRRIVDRELRNLLPAAVRVLYRTTVRQIAQAPDGLFNVEASESGGRAVSLRCRAVVLAGGACDRLSEQWGISGCRLVMPSISAYLPDPGIAAPAFEFLAECRPGYRWVFPSPDGVVNAGICALGPTKGSELKSLGAALSSAYRISGELRWRGGSGGLWSGEGRCWHHAAGLVSCGDAAGLVDPVNGEGLTAALASGLAAGEAAARFLLGNRDAGELRCYSEWVRAHFDAKYAPSAVRTAWKRLCGIGT